MLQCVFYKSTIIIEPLSSTLYGVNTCFIKQPPTSENFEFDIKFFKEWSIVKKFEMCF